MFNIGDIVRSKVGDLIIFEITQMTRFGENINYTNEHIDGYFEAKDLVLVDLNYFDKE
jgi:hypothetical protein